MPDPVRANRIATATRELLKECEGQPYDVRFRFAVLIPTLRGHKVLLVNFKHDPWGSTGACENCGQAVKVTHEGTSVEGRAVENDCPAAEWRRP